MNKKQFIPFIIAFLILLLTESLIQFSNLSCFFDKEIENVLPEKLSQLQKKAPQKIDILCLGSSRTHYGLIPAYLSTNLSRNPLTYNLGVPGSDYSNLYFILKDYVDHYRKPKTVILEVSEFLFNPNAPTTYTVLLPKTLMLDNPLLTVDILQDPYPKAQYKKEILLSSVSNIYRYRSLIKPLQLLYYLKHGFQDTPYPLDPANNGWQARKKNTLLDNPGNLNHLIREREDWLLRNYASVEDKPFRRLLDFCQLNKIQVILVQLPLHPAFISHLSTQNIYVNYLKSLHRNTKQYHYQLVDLTQAESDKKYSEDFADPKDFADLDHLNSNGAKKYSIQLAKRLKDADYLAVR